MAKSSRTKTSQQKALERFRNRLGEQGLVRFEVTGRDQDRELVRVFARHLAAGGTEAERLRSLVREAAGTGERKKGSILNALLASPLKGANLDLTRPREAGRKVDL